MVTSLRRRPLASAVVASLLAVALLGLRLAIARDPELTWMAWNLMLAWVPVALAAVLARGGARRGGWPVLAPVAILWILFLPNAPYLVTDLIHLVGRRDGLPLLDAAVLSTFAVTGILLFVLAVRTVAALTRRAFGEGAARTLAIACVGLSAVGIYLGRVLRWNSWDLLTDPLGRAASLLAHLSDPVSLTVAVVATLAVALGLQLAIAVLMPSGRRVRR